MLELQDEREERRSENQADGDTGDDEHRALLRGFASGWEPNEVVGCTARRAGITRYQARAERALKSAAGGRAWSSPASCRWGRVLLRLCPSGGQCRLEFQSRRIRKRVCAGKMSDEALLVYRM